MSLGEENVGFLETFREILRNLKQRKPTPKYCPKCGSPELTLSSKYDMWILPEQYICKKCGYKGPIVMELEDEEKKKKDEA